MSLAVCPLLACPYLSYILSLLSARDVYRCMSVCKKISDQIRRDIHKMDRLRVSLSIQFCNKTENFVENSDPNRVVVHGRYSWERQTTTTPFGFIFGDDQDSVSYYNARNIERQPFSNFYETKKLERGKRSDKESLMVEYLQLVFSRFDIIYLNLEGLMIIPEEMVAVIAEVARENRVRALRCISNTLRNYPICEAMECAQIQYSSWRPEEQNISIDMLNTTRTRIDITSSVADEIFTSLDPFRRMLKQWEAGEREILYLVVAKTTIYAPLPFDNYQVRDMLSGFDCQFVSSEQHNPRATLKRSLDGRTLDVAYYNDRHCIYFIQH